MLLLTLTLLASTYAQSSEYSEYEQEPDNEVPSYVPGKPPMVAPIDLTDEIYSKDFWNNPNAQNIIYNFEHIRHDQPPQVEAREESLGRYLYKPKPSTTPAPQAVRSADIHAPIPDVLWYQHQHALNSRVPTTTAASLPEWQDTYEQDHQLHSQHRSWNRAQEQAHVPTQPRRIPTRIPTREVPLSQWADYSYTSTPKPRTWSDPILGDGYKPDHPNPKPTTAPLIPRYSEQAQVANNVMARFAAQTPVERSTRASHFVRNTAPTTSTWEETKSPSDHTHHRPRNGAGRGSNKFNWSDVGDTDTAVIPSNTAAPLPVPSKSRGPPPAVPTLTPWHGDRF